MGHNKCRAAANLRGGHIACDLATLHDGLAHSNREHEIIWASEAEVDAFPRPIESPSGWVGL